MFLYHATSLLRLAGIHREGMRAGSYWASNDELADYYVETIEDEGQAPVILQVELSDLDEAHLMPDRPSLDEPITTVIDLDEEQVQQLWSESDKSWKASLDIVQSVRYMAPIAAEKILVIGPVETMRIDDFLASQHVKDLVQA